MEKRTMGSLLAALRKSKGMTQQDLADKLGISNKTVSKWECDEGYPDITMLPVIAEIYGITVDELLRGEIRNGERAEKAFSSEKGIKQIEFMLENSFVKFKSVSIIAIILSLLSPIMCFITQNILKDYLFRPTATLIALGISLIFAAAGIIIEWICANKLLFSLSGEDAQKCESKLIAYLKTLRNHIFAVILFALIGIFSGIASYFSVYYDIDSPLPVGLGIAIAVLVSLLLFLAVGNRLLGLISNEEIKKKTAYNQKTLKGAVIGTVCVALCASAIAAVTVKRAASHSFTFKNQENYKAFEACVFDSKYVLISEDDESLTVTVTDFNIIINGIWQYETVTVRESINEPEVSNGEFTLTRDDGGQIQLATYEMNFDSKEKMQTFIEENCVSSDFLKEIPTSLLFECKSVPYFNAEKLSVKYSVRIYDSDINVCVFTVLVLCVGYNLIYIAVRSKKKKNLL